MGRASNPTPQMGGDISRIQSIFRSDMGYACAPIRASTLPVLLAGFF